MYHRMTWRVTPLLTVLAVFLSLGLGEHTAVASQSAQVRSASDTAREAAEAARAAAAKAQEKSTADRMAELIKAAATYSGCGSKSLLEKPRCYRAFAEQSVRTGAGVGLFGFTAHEGAKDLVQNLGNIQKLQAELAPFQKLLQQDPASIADPAERAKAEERLKTAARAAEKTIDAMQTVAVLVIESVQVLIEAVKSLVKLLIALVEALTKLIELVLMLHDAIIEMNKILDDINAGMSQMNRALDDMNDAVGDVNSALDGMNRGIAQANRGMDQMNQGIAQANRGVDKMNKEIPKIKKAAAKLRELPAIDFDFSHIGDTWASGSSGLDSAEQDRRMSLLLGLIPGIGDGKGVVEAITGKDLATGEKLDAYDRATGSLFVLRWIKAGGKALKPDDIRKDKSIPGCNSFPAGTAVLMGDGSRKPIEDVQSGDLVLATDPTGDTPLTRVQPVLSAIVTESDKEFTRLTAENGATVTSTGHHLYWSADRRDWVRADELVPGSRLLDGEGRELTVAGSERLAAEQTTYDLDVSGIDSYYVGVGERSALVHNCNDLARDAVLYPGLAHTLDEHVDVTLEQMKQLAIKKTRKYGKPTSNSRWVDRQTAQQVVDYAVAANKAKIQDWLRKGATKPLELRGTFGAKNSLGDVMTHDGKHSKAGNGYVVLLQRAPGHKPGGYYVSTAYPI